MLFFQRQSNETSKQNRKQTKQLVGRRMSANRQAEHRDNIFFESLADWLLADQDNTKKTSQISAANALKIGGTISSQSKLLQLFKILHRKAFHHARKKLRGNPPPGFITKRLYHKIHKGLYDMNHMGLTSCDHALYFLYIPKLDRTSHVKPPKFPTSIRLGTEPSINPTTTQRLPIKSGPACQIWLSAVANGQLNNFNELQVIDPKRQSYVLFRRNNPQLSFLKQIYENFQKLPLSCRQNNDIASTLLLVIALKLRAKLDDQKSTDALSKQYQDYAAKGEAYFYELLCATINPAHAAFAWLLQDEKDQWVFTPAPEFEHGHSLTACLEEALKTAMQNNDELGIWLDSSDIEALPDATNKQSKIDIMREARQSDLALQPQNKPAGFLQKMWTKLKTIIMAPFVWLYQFGLFIGKIRGKNVKGRMSNHQAHKQSAITRKEKLTCLRTALEQLHTITQKATPQPAASFKKAADTTDMLEKLLDNTDARLRQLEQQTPRQAA